MASDENIFQTAVEKLNSKSILLYIKMTMTISFAYRLLTKENAVSALHRLFVRGGERALGALPPLSY